MVGILQHAEIQGTLAPLCSPGGRRRQRMLVALAASRAEALIADGDPDKEDTGYCLNPGQQEEIIIHPTVVNVP